MFVSECKGKHLKLKKQNNELQFSRKTHNYLLLFKFFFTFVF